MRCTCLNTARDPFCPKHCLFPKDSNIWMKTELVRPIIYDQMVEEHLGYPDIIKEDIVDILMNARYTAQLYDEYGTLLGLFPVNGQLVNGDTVRWEMTVSL